jgi:hypothetical protein
MSHRVWVISDLQTPYHDRRAVDNVAQAISDLKEPDDIVLTIGDEIDLDMISRWTAGSDKEWSRRIGKDRDLTVSVLRDLQVTDSIRSNHTDRLWKKLATSAPGFIGLPELEIENFLRMPELGITFHREAFAVAPGWLALHGDESGVSQLAGRTAANLSARTGTNVVCGHTHRMGLSGQTAGIYGRVTRTLWGMEVGNLMDMRSSGASYARVHNWQQGFGLLYVDGTRVNPVLVPIERRSFVVEGVRYAW